MNLSSDNGLIPQGCCYSGFADLLQEAVAGVDDVWNASPSIYDSVESEYRAHKNDVSPGNSGSSTRKVLYSGASTTVTVGLESTMNDPLCQF